MERLSRIVLEYNFLHKEVVEQDFRAIADAGLNSIRVYTIPR